MTAHVTRLKGEIDTVTCKCSNVSRRIGMGRMLTS